MGMAQGPRAKVRRVHQAKRFQHGAASSPLRRHHSHHGVREGLNARATEQLLSYEVQDFDLDLPSRLM